MAYQIYFELTENENTAYENLWKEAKVFLRRKFIAPNACIGTSLVAQWLRIRLPLQGTRVQFLVRELDPTCMPRLRVHMPQLRSTYATTKEPASHN